MNILSEMSVAWALILALAPFPLQGHRQGSALSRIAPEQMQAEYSRGALTNGWTDYIYSAAKKKLYVLSLEPQVDTAKHVIGIDIVLRDVDEPNADENLLDPPGKWHGLQPYSFMARDLVNGPRGSAFGPRRSIAITNRGLSIGIRILCVRISTLPDSTHEISELRLSLSADNLSN